MFFKPTNKTNSQLSAFFILTFFSLLNELTEECAASPMGTTTSNSTDLSQTTATTEDAAPKHIILFIVGFAIVAIVTLYGYFLLCKEDCCNKYPSDESMRLLPR